MTNYDEDEEEWGSPLHDGSSMDVVPGWVISSNRISRVAVADHQLLGITQGMGGGGGGGGGSASGNTDANGAAAAAATQWHAMLRELVIWDDNGEQDDNDVESDEGEEEDEESDAGEKGLVQLPNDFGTRFPKLETLNLFKCENLSTLPDSIGSCTSLATLKLRGCENLSTLPGSIGSCTALTTLYLRYGENLSTLPASIGSCTALATLNLYNCYKLSTLPDSIGGCTALATLDLYGCDKLPADAKATIEALVAANKVRHKATAIAAATATATTALAIAQIETLKTRIHDLLAVYHHPTKATQKADAYIAQCTAASQLPELEALLGRLTAEYCPAMPRPPTAAVRAGATVLVIGPGFGFLANPQQLRCIEAAGFTVQKCFAPNPEDTAFSMPDSIAMVLAAIAAHNPAVILCASKGGAYMVELWARMEAGTIAKIPSLMINAHPQCTSLPSEPKIVIVQGDGEEVWPKPRGYAKPAGKVEPGSLEALIRTGSPKLCYLYHTVSKGGLRARHGDTHTPT
jgi:hypothetical protein